MAIQPIDLQVLFARLNQIGREQMAHRNMLVQSQAVAGNEIAQHSEEQDRRVNETNNLEGGPEQANDEDERGQQNAETGQRESSEQDAAREFFRDPDLGQNVDVSG